MARYRPRTALTIEGDRTCEFHVARSARERYRFDQALFSIRGNVIFADFHAARLFAQAMNRRREVARFPEQAVRAGQINAMGLIDEALHFVVGLYRRQVNPQAMAQALDWLDERLGKEAVDGALRRFVDEFPPLAVYRREIGVEAYLADQAEGVPHRQIALEEMLLLYLANANPAFSPFIELFEDASLEKTTAYAPLLRQLHAFFETQPPFGPDSQNLVEMLRSPAVAVPHSLSGQLEYIRTRWAGLLGDLFLRLLRGMDLIREEEKAALPGPGIARVYEFAGLEAEGERYSPDREWMPSLVLIAKNTYVWLEQLSRQYGRSISRLDEIPGEVLDRLAGWGFNGLWLIGLWERSPASRRIKQLRGNPEAEASAYSLFEYSIAADLGGEPAYQALRQQAWQRGIRLASDMVPNHMGIDSRWVIEHPEWFLSLDYNPFPAYSFNGPDLSWDERVGIYLEDHYYDGSDAAVVFKRLDRWTGNVRYIYHGNDGTSTPWNDTAQLNYLVPEARQAVIQTILGIARMFPILRFDAAMTLAKKHYQRLWFPQPGAGGAIPSRAEHSLTKEEFDARFPKEFWREVVERAAQEAPDTLLLAEAFWLMEGYFVRTLGMHRVYNSAFMHMLRDERNQEYRLVIKNTLEFDPEILKRYVNFMNNPDERTAVDQFGKGDKYFGVCTLLCTMPGLPMFGHGQVEGYAEKYGMEFRRPYWEELPDPALVERHERQIFPLLRRRAQFSEVRDFLLYDFFTPEGAVNEDVFAYSNRAGDARSLVVYNNRYAEARGWIRTSAAYSIKKPQGEGRYLEQKTLAEGLDLPDEEGSFTIFRDHVSGMEYIRSCRQLHGEGLYLELGAYGCYVFLDFRLARHDERHPYARLAEYLNGRGVPDVEEALQETYLFPLHESFRQLVNAGSIRWLVENRPRQAGESLRPKVLAEAEEKAARLLERVNEWTGAGRDPSTLRGLAAGLANEYRIALELPAMAARRREGTASLFAEAVGRALQGLSLLPEAAAGGAPGESGANLGAWGALLAWIAVHGLGKAADEAQGAAISRSWFDEWALGKIVAAALRELGQEEGEAWRSVEAIRLLCAYQAWFRMPGSGDERAASVLESWLEDADVQRYLQVNRFAGVLWFNREAYRQLLSWMLMAAILAELAAPERGAAPERIAGHYRVIRRLFEIEAASGYRVDRLLEALEVGRGGSS